MMGTAQGLLQVHPINEDSGYVKIKVKQVEIGNDADTILHVIDPDEMSQILYQLEQNFNYLKLEDRQALKAELKIIKSKLKTIQRPNRQKRGLVNFVGKAQNWLFGTMDDTDRTEILEHLRVIDENNHNAIQTLNKQIKINNHYNKTLSDLKVLIENDRKKFLDAANVTNQHVKEMNYKILYLDQETKLRYFENKVNQILDNIMATKINVFHPSMLTLEELETYKIDFHKLRLIKAGVTEYKDRYLIFAIKIPKTYIVTELQLIKPVPNLKGFEINEQDELVIEINGKNYQYEDNILLKNLKESKNCIFKGRCSLILNNVTSIEEIDDESILLKNMYNDSLWQNCDKRRINLTGNYLINFNNCSLGIRNRKFYNKKITLLDKFFYPANEVKIFHVKPINLDKIVFENVENIKEIKELKYHRNVMYGTSMSLTFILIISIIGIIFYISWQNKNGKIKIVNNAKPEASDLNRGGVTSADSNLPDSHQIRLKAKPLAW